MVLPQIAYMPKSDMMSWRVSNLLNFHGVVRSTNNPSGLFSRACVRTGDLLERPVKSRNGGQKVGQNKNILGNSANE